MDRRSLRYARPRLADARASASAEPAASRVAFFGAAARRRRAGAAATGAAAAGDFGGQGRHRADGSRSPSESESDSLSDSPKMASVIVRGALGAAAFGGCAARRAAAAAASRARKSSQCEQPQGRSTAGGGGGGGGGGGATAGRIAGDGALALLFGAGAFAGRPPPLAGAFRGAFFAGAFRGDLLPRAGSATNCCCVLRFREPKQMLSRSRPLSVFQPLRKSDIVGADAVVGASLN
jgi:hypothetical protein